MIYFSVKKMTGDEENDPCNARGSPITPPQEQVNDKAISSTRELSKAQLRMALQDMEEWCAKSEAWLKVERDWYKGIEANMRAQPVRIRNLGKVYPNIVVY